MKRWALLLVLLLLVACGVNRPVGEPRTYLLEAVGRSPSAAAGDLVLLITRPSAEPGFDSDGIAYTETPLSLSYYTQSRWADAPARMLGPLLVETLERSGAFRAVVIAPSSVAADLQLDVTLLRLQQSFLQSPSRVELALRARLIDIADNRVLAGRTFEATEPTPSEDAYGGVQAANAALERVLTELAGFVVAHR
jgi:cholesterol transport system auxiliary component